jgi:hypothetical protein
MTGERAYFPDAGIDLVASVAFREKAPQAFGRNILGDPLGI